MKVKNLLEAVLGIVLGVILYPLVDSICTSAAENTSNEYAALILPIVPIVYLFIVIGGAGAYLYSSAK